MDRLRLFTALWPDEAVVHALSTRLAGYTEAGEHRGWPPAGWRVTPPDRWHVTLCFHGDADRAELTERLATRAAGRPAPWLRLAGAVRFPAVLAAAVRPASPADAEAFAGLVSAAGGEPAEHRAHLTVARARRGHSRPAGRGPLDDYRGPWWCPAEVCLVHSERRDGHWHYAVLHREPLGRPAAGPPPDTGP
ncbi:MAG TPA: 2'-5' RNA ligase family protein [Pseudonocardia sp.]|jgi:2'-5' RNA ligase